MKPQHSRASHPLPEEILPFVCAQRQHPVAAPQAIVLVLIPSILVRVAHI